MCVVQSPSSAPSMVALCGVDGGGDNEDIDDDDDYVESVENSSQCVCAHL